MNDGAGKKFRGTVSAVVIILASFFVSVAVVEFALARGWVAGIPPVSVPDFSTAAKSNVQRERIIRLRLNPPNMRRVYRPTEAYLKDRTDSLQPGEYVMETDSFGFICPGLEHKWPDLTLAFLGGSTTENFFMKPEERFHYGAARLLEERTGLKINSINAAKSGNVTLHSVNIFLNAVISHHPDIAILMHNINDYAVLYHERSYWNDHPERSLVRELPVVNAVSEGGPAVLPVGRAARLMANSLLISVIPNLASRLGLVFSAIRTGAPQAAPFDDEAQRRRWSVVKPFDMDRIERDFRHALVTFIAVARAWGVKPVLMTQPHRWPKQLTGKTPRSIRNFMERKAITGIDYLQFRAGYERMNEAIRQTARDYGVALIDLEPKIPPTTENLFDAIHLTGKGSRLASKVIAARLAEAFPLADMSSRRKSRSGSRP